METLVAALMVYAASALNLPIPAELPTVHMAGHCDIQRFALDNAAHVCTPDGIQAVYFNGEILLPDTWTAQSLYNVSMVLHEVAHYVQDQAGLIEDAECMLDVEFPAYEVQAEFLMAAGVKDPWGFMQIDPLFLVMVYQCGVPDYFNGAAK